MPENLVSGGLFFLFVAALWLLYLMPNWVRRREYLATERNALRLQQTLRVLASTSETPEEVTVAVNSRVVNEQEQLVLEQQKQLRAAYKARQSANARALKAQLKTAENAVQRQTYRIRRSRLLSTSILLLSFITLTVGIVIFASTPFVATWLIIGGTLFGLGSLIILRQLAVVSARLAKQRQEFVPRAPKNLVRQGMGLEDVEYSSVDQTHARDTAANGQAQKWTPQGIPQPRYIANAERVQPAQVDHGVQEDLLIAVEKAKERLRQAQKHVPGVPAHAKDQLASLVDQQHYSTVSAKETASAAAQSAQPVANEMPLRATGTETVVASSSEQRRYSVMGKVSVDNIVRPDFDAALARRRRRDQ